jgi:methylthioribose-1-phosphate isomerase
MQTYSNIRPIRWENGVLILLDQRKLPDQESYVSINKYKEVAAAISEMIVRGAPAIGVTAAFGVVLAALEFQDLENWRIKLDQAIEFLKESRPTANNLGWALGKMRVLIDATPILDISALEKEAKSILKEDVQQNRLMGKLGAEFIKERGSILTHCNAGALATAGYGTALGVVRSAFANNKIDRVYADETRPWLQGTRLTAWELAMDNIPVTVLCDGASSSALRNKKITWVIVGADRIASNGDVVNKIGTYPLALLAKYHNVGFMVVAPTNTIDSNALSGDDIPIEERSAKELFEYAEKKFTKNNPSIWNPVFDITPADLIDVLVTEKGVIKNPNAKKLRKVIK